MNDGIFVAGQVLKTDHRKGEFKADGGDLIAYDHHSVKVLADDDVAFVKFKSDRVDTPVPNKGDRIAVQVELVRGQLVAIRYMPQPKG